MSTNSSVTIGPQVRHAVVRVGTPTNISCTIQHPVSWRFKSSTENVWGTIYNGYKLDRSYISNSNYNMSTAAGGDGWTTLSIQNTTVSDAGEYMCTKLGGDSRNIAHLVVLGKLLK